MKFLRLMDWSMQDRVQTDYAQAEAVDPMAQMQSDPTALLRQSAKTPGATQGMAIDPEILTALGNI